MSDLLKPLRLFVWVRQAEFNSKSWSTLGSFTSKTCFISAHNHTQFWVLSVKSRFSVQGWKHIPLFDPHRCSIWAAQSFIDLPSQHPCEAGKCCYPYLTDGELRDREDKWLSQGYTRSLWRNRDLNPDLTSCRLVPKSLYSSSHTLVTADNILASFKILPHRRHHNLMNETVLDFF